RGQEEAAALPLSPACGRGGGPTHPMPAAMTVEHRLRPSLSAGIEPRASALPSDPCGRGEEGWPRSRRLPFSLFMGRSGPDHSDAGARRPDSRHGFIREPCSRDHAGAGVTCIAPEAGPAASLDAQTIGWHKVMRYYNALHENDGVAA